MTGTVLVTLAGAITAWFSARSPLAGQPRLYLLLLLAELPVALLALFFLHRQNRLRATLVPRPGDVLKGVSMAGVLVLAIWSARALLMPHGSERVAWLFRLYLQLGDPSVLEKRWWVPLVVLLWGGTDEIVWRGWLQGVLRDKLGGYAGLVGSSLAYAAQTLPLAYLLSDPVCGYNPLVPLLALGTGLAWAQLTHLSDGRIVPAMISHATLAYFTLLQFRPGL